MATLEEDKKQPDGDDELLKLLEKQENRTGRATSGGMGSFLKGLPIGIIVVVIVVIVLAIMVFSLSSEVSNLEGEIAGIKNVKAQMAELEGRIEKFSKENETMRTEISRLKGETDSLRAQRRQAEIRSRAAKQQTVNKQQPLGQTKPKVTVPAAKGKGAAPLKATTQQKSQLKR